MTKLWLCRLALALSIIGISLAPVHAQKSGNTDPSKTYSGFPCSLDLTGLNPDYKKDDRTHIEITTDSTRQCTGSLSYENVFLDCHASFPNWGKDPVWGNGRETGEVACQINVSGCEVLCDPDRHLEGDDPNFGCVGGSPLQLVEATSATLTIDRRGKATLSCKWQP